jgi:hypothetical protein
MESDMSPEAVGRRIRKVGELVRLCRALRIKPTGASGHKLGVVNPAAHPSNGRGTFMGKVAIWRRRVARFTG